LNNGFPKRNEFLPEGKRAGFFVMPDSLGFADKYANPHASDRIDSPKPLSDRYGTKEMSELYIQKHTGDIFLQVCFL
jgi:hypothetical protein